MSELIDMHENNNGLCSFGTRWRIEGDYIRCGTCDRPQLTSYADHDFPHADFCRVKDSPAMERRPWRAYVELLAPLCRAPVQEAQAVACYGIRKKGETAIIGIIPAKIHDKPATAEWYVENYEEVPLYDAPPSRAQVVDVNMLRPRNWTREMSDAWHRNIPDTVKAFDSLLEAALEGK